MNAMDAMVERRWIEGLRVSNIAWAEKAPGTGKMKKASEWSRKLIEFDRTLEQP